MITPAGSSVPTLFLPATGARGSHGELENVGLIGYYWSNTVGGGNPASVGARILFFDNNNVSLENSVVA